MTNSKKNSNLATAAAVAGAAAVGAAVGAAAAVMSDPKKAKQVKTQVNKVLAQGKDFAEEWAAKGKKMVTDVEGKVDEAKEDLEKKLKSHS